jgi:hypothetical protein
MLCLLFWGSSSVASRPRFSPTRDLVSRSAKDPSRHVHMNTALLKETWVAVMYDDFQMATTNKVPEKSSKSSTLMHKHGHFIRSAILTRSDQASLGVLSKFPGLIRSDSPSLPYFSSLSCRCLAGSRCQNMKYVSLRIVEVSEVVVCFSSRSRSGVLSLVSRFFYGHLANYCGDLDSGCREA